jgi:DNA-binding MurR/RpiR family transcriptional regulator
MSDNDEALAIANLADSAGAQVIAITADWSRSAF